VVSDRTMRWLPKFQLPGVGIAIVSTIAPTLGIPIPLGMRWIMLSIGLLMWASPILEAGYAWAKRPRRMIQFLGIIVCGFSFVGFGAWYYWPFGLSGDTPDVRQIRNQLAQFEQIGPLFAYFESDKIGDAFLQSTFIVPSAETAQGHIYIPFILAFAPTQTRMLEVYTCQQFPTARYSH
jgi:hypothetical protein